MAKRIAKFNKIALSIASALFILFPFIGVSGGVKAAAETEGTDSAIMWELGGLTIGGEKFDAADYPADQEGTPALLNLNELGYGYTAEKQVAYSLILYIYNPAQLNIQEDLRNAVQMRIGNAERFGKYALNVIESSSDKLFYKLGVSFTDTEKSAALAALDKDSRVYEVSSLEFYLEGFNATSFDISPTRVFTYTGYAAGLGDGAESTLTHTLSYTVKGGAETIPLSVEHTSWRPEGTNGKTAWTYDTIHSVYFAVPKELDEKYDYLKSVQAHWTEARLAPVYVTANKDLADDLEQLYRYNFDKAVLESEDYPMGELLSFAYGGLSEYTCGMNKPFEWYLLTWEIKSSAFDPNGYSDLFFGSKDARDTVESQRKEFKRRLSDLSLFVYTNGESASDYVVTSNELTQLVQGRTEEIMNAFPHNKDYPVAGKYPAFLFDDWNLDTTTAIITIGDESDYEVADEGTVVITKDKLDLYSEEIKQEWWQKLFGGTYVENNKDYEGIDAIKVITDDDVRDDMSPKELSNSLYISERDAADFEAFYKYNKNNSTIYLMRFAVSEYWAQPTDEYKKEGQAFYSKKGEGYFAQETCYLDFDIIDFEYVKDDETFVIPVSMSPIDIFPELTPPPKYDDDFCPYGLAIMGGLIAFYVVYKISCKVARG